MVSFLLSEDGLEGLGVEIRQIDRVSTRFASLQRRLANIAMKAVQKRATIDEEGSHCGLQPRPVRGLRVSYSDRRDSFPAFENVRPKLGHRR
jgi:hypothetical protein